MRWFLLTAFLVSVGLATYAGLEREPAIEIDVEVGYALPELSAYHSVENRGWSGRIDIAAQSTRPCRSMKVVANQQPSGQYGEEPFVRLEGPGSRIRGSGTYAIYAGQPYRIGVSASCHGDAGDGASSSAKTTVRADYRPCGGSVRVLRSTSAAAHVGTVLEARERLVVDRPVVVGAPECNGFHATLLPGTTGIGSYGLSGRRTAFWGRGITVSRGDEHGGDFRVLSTPLAVRPRGVACADCKLLLPSAYAVRSRARGTRVVVRVYSGVVDVTGAGQVRRLTQWHDGFFACADVTTSCRLVEVRLVQPGDPLTVLPRVARLRTLLPGSSTPPAEALAPPRASARVSPVATAGGEPRELVVEWHRLTRTESDRYKRGESGLFVWQHVAGAWRLVVRYYASRFVPDLSARLADVTGDGHRDVLVDNATGSGNCGPRIVFASLQRRVREVYRQGFCDGRIEAGSGGLVERVPVGPCPYRSGGGHCYGGRSTTVLRLEDERLVPVSRTVECALPRLDPRRNCS